MKRKILTTFLCALIFVGANQNALSYEIDTHDKLSEEAAIVSVLTKDPTIIQNLGIKSSDKFVNSNNEPKTFAQLIRDGSRFEDTLTPIRPMNHFYNPLTGAALTLSGFAPGAPSPDWALEDKGQINGTLGFGKQEFSYQDARQYFFDALTQPDKTKREENFGKTFQTLGHLIHHVQDMAQPQHVRNDQHLDFGLTTGQTVGFCVVSPLACAAYLAIKNPSAYESYTNRPDVRGKLPTDFSAAGYDINDPKFASTFNSPRNLWHTADGKGLADYTNRGFVSAGTIFDSAFPSPVLDLSKKLDFDIKDLIPGTSLKGNVRFYGNTVTDNYTGASVNNPMAVTRSIFDAELEKYATLGKKSVYTLNRFNFDVAHSLLIPRAVGYSAGLINYFFRGKMQISLPPEGVYSLIDASAASGFSKIKLVLSNQSPPGEDMTGGQVVAIAKFHNNTCYKSDLSGEMGLPGNNYSACRSSAEQIIVSTPKPLSLAVASTAPLTFDFSSPIPLSATDLYLQVVYRGQLGQELDAVAVTTLDIAEPTTFDITNMTDYVLENGIYYYVPDPYDPTGLPSAALYGRKTLERQSLSYAFNFGGSASGSVTVPASSFARMGILTNTTGVFLNLTKVSYGYSRVLPVYPNLNQLDPVTGVPDFSTPAFARGRYLYQDSPDYLFYPALITTPPGPIWLGNLAPQPINTIVFPAP